MAVLPGAVEERADGRVAQSTVEHLLEGYQVIDREFRYLYVNEAVETRARLETTQIVGRTMAEVFPGIDQTPMFEVLRRCMVERAPAQMENEFSFPDGSKGWFELRFQPVPDGVAVLSLDVTAQRRAEDALQRKNRALMVLSETNHALVRATEEGAFLHAVCRIAVERGGYRMAWIGKRENDAKRSLLPVAHAGIEEGCIARLDVACVNCDGGARGCGPTGRAIATGERVVARCIAASEEYAPWQEDALARGLGSSIALPVRIGSECFGAINLYAAEPDAFDDEERDLLGQVAQDLGFGIDTLRARAERKRAVSEERRMRQELLASAQRMQIVLNLANIVVWSAKRRPEGDEVLEVSPSFERIMGRPIAELRANPRLWLEVVHPEDRALAERSAEELFARGHATAEYRMVRPDGGVRWLVDQRAVLRDATGNVLQIAGAAHDVTERRQADEELRRLNAELEARVSARTQELASAIERLRLVLDSTSDGIYGIDLDGRCSFANEATLSLLGYASADEVIGRNNHELFHSVRADGTPYDVADCPIYHVLQGGRWEGVHHEVFLRKDGTTIPVEYRVRPKEQDGRAAGCVVTFTDITERRHVEAELVAAKRAAEAANEAKSVFLANMSHELRTPMNAVLGFTQLLLRDPSTTPPQRQHLETVGRAGDHLLELIDEVLQLARIESGRLRLEESTIDLRAMLAELDLMFRPRAAAKGLRLLVEIGAGDVPCYVVVDADKVRRILSNLLSNAIKFTEEGGVSVRMGPKGAPGALRLVVEIEDTGHGIASEEMPRLFRRFEQTASGRRSKQGTGLGLAISRELARLMGGDVGVRSQPDVGSVFRLSIPVREGSAEDVQTMARGRKVKGLRPGQRRCRVLVVDDKPDNRTFAVGLLQAVGFETAQASDGQEAIAELERCEPDLVLMDTRMPVLGGAEAIARIRKMPCGAALKIVIVTASAFEEDRVAAADVGADDFLRKPFRAEDLFEKIGALLGVEYDYDEEQSALAAPARAEDALTPERVSVLPPELRAKLHQAALAADVDAILAMLDRVEGAKETAVAARLRGLAERFDYEVILDLLAPETREHETPEGSHG